MTIISETLIFAVQTRHNIGTYLIYGFVSSSSHPKNPVRECSVAPFPRYLSRFQGKIFGNSVLPKWCKYCRYLNSEWLNTNMSQGQNRAVPHAICRFVFEVLQELGHPEHGLNEYSQKADNLNKEDGVEHQVSYR